MSDSSEAKLRMLGAGGSFWGSTVWNVQRWQRGFSQWRESTDMRTSVTQLTPSWTMTSPWWRLPKISCLQITSATPACHTSRPASNRDTTAGSQAGETPEVCGAPGVFLYSPVQFPTDNCAESTGGKENVSLAEALNQARLPIIDFTTCKQKKFWGDRVQDSMICAGFKDTGDPPAACQVRLMTVCKWTNTGLNHWADTYRYKSRRKYNLYFSRDFLFQLLLCCL